MYDMSMDSTSLFVKDTVQTFIDNVIIESVQNTTRRWHTPTRKLEQPVIRKDQPWERIPYFSGSDYRVIRDPEDGLFKCWYMNLDQSKRWMGTGFHDLVHPGGSKTCYAESEDGLQWTKPELDIYEENGRKTNVVMGGNDHRGAHFGVVLDPHPPTRDQRYRVLYTHFWDEQGTRMRRIESAHSADGIHWTTYDELPIFGMSGGYLGDVSILFYDNNAREFVQNTRHFAMESGPGVNPLTPRTQSFANPYEPHNFAAYNRRRIFQTRSHDMIHWSEPVPVAATDDIEDNLDESFYGMPQFTLGNVHLATVGVLRFVENEMHVQLLVSRDGIRWSRTNKRQPFIAPRGEGYWDAHMVSSCSPPIEVGDELRFYHGGTDRHHDWWIFGQAEGIDVAEALEPEGGTWGLGLATLRKDGYAGLYSTKYREGIIVTRPLISLGTKLEINAKCGVSGSVKVEVVDHNNNVIGSCSKDNCDPLTGDSVKHTVTWNRDASIPTSRGHGTWRKLRFFLKDAELFSFRFTNVMEDQNLYDYSGASHLPGAMRGDSE